MLQYFLLVLLLYLPSLCSCQQINTTSPLRDPNTIQSPGRVFQLGFFTPLNSTNRYLGVFYTVSQQVVIWVANRDRPINDTSSHVSVSPTGNLVLRNGVNEVIWSTNVKTSSPRSTSARLEDTGNLVVRDIVSGNTIWESFSEPSDTFLPSLHIVDDTNTNRSVFISAWRKPNDPGTGGFMTKLDVRNIPQIVTWNNGRPYWRSGPWNGHIMIGVQAMYSVYLDKLSVVNDPPGYYYFTAPVGTFLMRFTLNSTGRLVQTLWNEQRQNWDVIWVAPLHKCDVYGTCGPFGSCNALNSPICSCLMGFEPANQDEWSKGNWTSGCLRRKQLHCDVQSNSTTNGTSDGFVRLHFTKVPDFPEQLRSRNGDGCRSRCLGNCSCLAYAHDPAIGCMFWSKNLIDIQRFDGVGIDLYLRLDASEIDNNQDRRRAIIISVIVGFAAICLGVLIAWLWMVKRRGRKATDKKFFEARKNFMSNSTSIVLKDETENVNIEDLPLFTFKTLAIATSQFDENNILGKGGFGSVYKGILASGQEIAVKRLSAASGQGNIEFMNEVVVIAKLQHRNLVRLLGCCVEREEKMLIYEHMPNKSLDLCLFDPTHSSQKILDWKERVNIIEGIGRGLVYLHRDSRLKIIHRDLKPSNILLDEEWNPKISDFGMARIFGENEEHGNTVRVVGTYGYMSPEYAVEGRFSEKSDVYSFGVIMLEILSGKKNTRYYNEELSLSLLGYAWKLWSEGNGLSFVDQAIASPQVQVDIVRCIQIALLCAQELPNDRPATQTVLSMLTREIADLPVPFDPAFAEKWNKTQVDSTYSHFGNSSSELTFTALNGDEHSY